MSRKTETGWSDGELAIESELIDRIIPKLAKVLVAIMEIEDLAGNSRSGVCEACNLVDVEGRIIDALTACREFQSFADSGKEEASK